MSINWDAGMHNKTTWSQGIKEILQQFLSNILQFDAKLLDEVLILSSNDAHQSQGMTGCETSIHRNRAFPFSLVWVFQNQTIAEFQD